MVAHFIHEIDIAATSAAEAPDGATELFSDRFLFFLIVAGGLLAQGHGYGLTARKLSTNPLAKTLTGKLSVRTCALRWALRRP